MLHARWIRNQEGHLVMAWTRDKAPAATEERPLAKVIPINRNAGKVKHRVYAKVG